MAAVTICRDFGAQKIKRHLGSPKFRSWNHLIAGQWLFYMCLHLYTMFILTDMNKALPQTLCTTENIYLEKAMAPHSSTLAWKIPWTEEPARLQSMRLLRVGHDWATSLLLFTFMQWRRQWQPTPVFLPGESQGRWSLVGYRLWGRTESDMTDAT